MGSWHLWLTILSLTSTYLSSVIAGTAFCTFEHTTTYHSDLIPDHISGYLCKLDLDIKGDRVDNIGGNHENGEKSSEVNIIMVLKEFYTYLTSFPDAFCSRFENLEIIDMSGAQIETIEENSLEKCKELRILQFYINNIKEVPENLLTKNKKLLKLYITYNSITTLPENLLSGLSNLEILDLSYNHLMSIPSGILRDLRSLKELSLEGNQIKILEAGLFEDLENLEKLSLAHNSISELPMSIFSNLVNLKELMLQQNDLTVIHAESFPQEAKIDLVVLSKNKIDAIDEYFIDNCGISKLKMGGNICDRTAVIGKKDLKKKLRKCFKNYDIIVQDPLLTSTSSTTTTEPTTTRSPTRSPRTTSTRISTTTPDPITTTSTTQKITTKPRPQTTTTTVEITSTTTPKPTTTTITEPIKSSTIKSTSTTTTTPIQMKPILSRPKPPSTTEPLNQIKLQAIHEPCGVAKVGVPNIVGGEEIARNTHPWIAALIYKEQYFCGGTLVTRRKVVTAAHCILAKGSTEKDAEDMLVILGGHQLDNPMEVGRVSVGVQSFEIHPKWNPLGDKFDADIAVLVLDEDIEFNFYIQPVCLTRSRKDILNYTDGIIVGFGKSEKSKSHENVPMKANTPIRTSEDCYYEFPNLSNIASHRTFCGGFANGTGSCTGDSGGGLTVVSYGRHFLRGVISASLYAQEYGCDVNSYSIFTDISFFIPFVNKVKVESN